MNWEFICMELSARIILDINERVSCIHDFDLLSGP